MSEKKQPPKHFYTDSEGVWKWAVPEDQYITKEGALMFRPHPESEQRKQSGKEKDMRDRGGRDR